MSTSAETPSSSVSAPAPALALALPTNGGLEFDKEARMRQDDINPCTGLPILLSMDPKPTNGSYSQPPQSDTSLSSLSDFDSLIFQTGYQDSRSDEEGANDDHFINNAEDVASTLNNALAGEDEGDSLSDISPLLSFQEDQSGDLTISLEDELTITMAENYSSASSSLHDNLDRSKISSLTPSNIASKATTPIDIMDKPISQSTVPSPQCRPENIPKLHTPSPVVSRISQTSRVRPRSSIPHSIQPKEYASQCITAAEMCRLSPYALHPGENLLLRAYISRPQVTTYLNIRNGILRLWVRNPQVAVLREEAVGCTSKGWFEVASLCYDWLVRNGFINFGCVKYSKQFDKSPDQVDGASKRKTIVIIGAGVSGLGCARQLDGLFQQYSSDFTLQCQQPPRIIILEARDRVGGRVYSKPFNYTPKNNKMFNGTRQTAEMGAMIVTGFYGNPLNFLIRGQLGLDYHCLRPETTLYDSNGEPADIKSDQLVEHLFNDSLDRVSEYKFDIKMPPLIMGNIQSIIDGRDGGSDGSWTLKQIDDAANVEASLLSRRLASERLRSVGDFSKYGRAAIKAREMGWSVNSGVKATTTINLDAAAHADKTCMGLVFEEAIRQYTDIVNLEPAHFRLLNWHVANLEYSNATDLHNLSLGGWDIDAGNEWEGKHTMIVGGYQSMARGLLMCPEPLDCRFLSPVQKIIYASKFDSTNQDHKAAVICEDGTRIDADCIVSSIPLGVLKAESIAFEPELPEWKKGAINRVGYGVLNKVILTYQEPFWETDRDIFGILRDPANPDSMRQEEYAENRGRLFQWFNVSISSGLPCLVALMAGKAGYATENEDDESLVREATMLLRKVFGEDVPYPEEVIVTRWASDKYSYGSYSSSGPEMEWDDYDKLAKPIGNLFFAGEHTIGTHPATVHGAYISGLRAASEVFASILGPLQVPEPLFPTKTASGSSLKRKATTVQDLEKQLHHQHERSFQEFVLAKLGPMPVSLEQPPSNAYSLFRRENAKIIRQRCFNKRRSSKGKIPSKDTSQMASKIWRELSPDERAMYEKRYQTAVVEYKKSVSGSAQTLATREAQVAELRKQFDESFSSKKVHQETPYIRASQVKGSKSSELKSELEPNSISRGMRDSTSVDTESSSIRLSGFPARKTRPVSYVEDSDMDEF
ncbi:hypothetical protein BROUX41_005417 [Berkeleyomyces rouxiae]|uniref:uncharacterized protein n=1 Tax=Berkeleyomyces rouxiae TaxID=2035830 RepID=UPI003B7BF756